MSRHSDKALLQEISKKPILATCRKGTNKYQESILFSAKKSSHHKLTLFNN